MITFRELGRTGRLGNMLFQVAGVIGIARKSNQPFAFPKLICHDMVERFGSKEDPNVYQYLQNELPHISVDEIDRMYFQRYPYFWEYRDIVLPQGDWDMYAHFQSIKFFDHCMDEVRHYFTFKDEYFSNHLIALHFRGGDYIDDEQAYHPRCSKDYYMKAINLFPNGTEFLVFTDDWDAFHEMDLPGSRDHVRFHLTKGMNYIDSFRQMKACHSFICANSSFSHFAALLGTHPDKKIIMPRRWFGTQAGGLSFDTLYPPNAIVI